MKTKFIIPLFLILCSAIFSGCDLESSTMDYGKDTDGRGGENIVEDMMSGVKDGTKDAVDRAKNMVGEVKEEASKNF